MTIPFASEPVLVASGETRLAGVLELPRNPRGVVLFADASGRSRLSPRNNYVAGVLRRAGLGTLLLELRSRDENSQHEHRFDAALLVGRLGDAAHWLAQQPETRGLALGLLGSSAGAAVALQLAAGRPGEIAAVVSRGGRPELASTRELAQVRAPTLMIVGGDDHEVVELNRQALRELSCEKELAVVRGATHQFEEPGALGEVARLAARWFKGYLGA